MPRHFFISTVVSGNDVALDPPVAEHVVRSLRMRAGDRFVVVDAAGREHGVRLRGAQPGTPPSAERLWTRPSGGEPRLRIAVVQALARDRMEDCIDALVEVGAAAVHPVLTEHVVARPSADRLAERTRRWQAVASESAQLAGRGVVPMVHPTSTLAAALGALPQGCRVIACAFEGTTPLSELAPDPERPLAVCIGPEGGFGADDLAMLAEAGAEMAHLGPRVMRTRYAGAVACALLLQRAGDISAAPEPPPW